MLPSGSRDGAARSPARAVARLSRRARAHIQTQRRTAEWLSQTSAQTRSLQAVACLRANNLEKAWPARGSARSARAALAPTGNRRVPYKFDTSSGDLSTATRGRRALCTCALGTVPRGDLIKARRWRLATGSTAVPESLRRRPRPGSKHCAVGRAAGAPEWPVLRVAAGFGDSTLLGGGAAARAAARGERRRRL